jgi:hypothetical protein
MCDTLRSILSTSKKKRKEDQGQESRVVWLEFELGPSKAKTSVRVAAVSSLWLLV